jgi:hypothetical protein
LGFIPRLAKNAWSAKMRFRRLGSASAVAATGIRSSTSTLPCYVSVPCARQYYSLSSSIRSSNGQHPMPPPFIFLSPHSSTEPPLDLPAHAPSTPPRTCRMAVSLGPFYPLSAQLPPAHVRRQVSWAWRVIFSVAGRLELDGWNVSGEKG